MDRMILKRLSWTVHIAWMRHGVMGGLALSALLIVLAMLLDVGNAYRRVRSLESEVSAKTVASLPRKTAGAPSDALLETPVFPIITARSNINGKILDILDRMEGGPEQVRFKYEASPEAGLARQVVVFNLKATWREIAALLDKLQRVDRSVFISRLKITRESIEEDVVEAEIQLGLITRASFDDGTQP
ncbi:MAG TPA: hypothetical protein VGE64_08945 [Xanthomonadaceae bacterium]